ncbi:MAG: pyridoxal-phosphate dependent enzyme, partial [Bacteroidota bacterium]
MDQVLFKHPTFDRAGIEVMVRHFQKTETDNLGNKYFKLLYNFEKAEQLKCKTLLTFGGPWSNHLYATAKLCKEKGMKCIGIVRGLQQDYETPTLRDCQEMGMELHRISREEYHLRDSSEYKQHLIETFGNVYIVPEGGSNFLGVQGTQEMVQRTDKDYFDHIAVCAGTGATATGIAQAFGKPILVFPAVKDIDSIQGMIKKHLTDSLFEDEAVEHFFELIHIQEGYHFGGFGKLNKDVVRFIK